MYLTYIQMFNTLKDKRINLNLGMTNVRSVKGGVEETTKVLWKLNIAKTSSFIEFSCN